MSLESVRPAVSLEQREINERIGDFSSLKRIKDASVSFARIASLVSVIAGGPSELAHAEGFQHGSYLTQSQLALIYETLDHNTSSGSLELANGHELSIPVAHDGYGDVDLFTPKSHRPVRVIIEFKQRHPRTKAEMASATSQKKIQELRDVEESQAKIYTALKNLSEHGVVHSVCSEGVINDDPTDAPSDIVLYQRKHGDISVLNRLAAYDTSMEALENDYDAALSTFDPERHASSAEKDRALQTLNTLESNIHVVVKPYSLVNGAAEVLAAEGSISLCGAENRATYDRSWSPAIIAEKKFSDPEHRAVVTKAVMTDREDVALKNALAEPGDGVAVVYGAAHDFSRTTAEYNLAHPDSPIALVIVDAFVYNPTPTDISSPRSTEHSSN